MQEGKGGVPTSGRRPEGTLELVSDSAVVLVKAAPRRSLTFGETVCCAGLDMEGRWVRLYPVSFRQLEDAQRFKRWDIIKYRWSRPKASKDRREESRRVDPQSVDIQKSLRSSERNPLVNRSTVTSLKREGEEGRSLALLKCEVLDFWADRRTDDDLRKSEEALSALRSQRDMFLPPALIPMRTCPYSFHYRYRDDDGEHVGTCQDWETEQTFFARLRDQANEAAALDWMLTKFGQEYPQKGMALAMGTHRYRLDQWLINGVVRVDPEPQLSLI